MNRSVIITGLIVAVLGKIAQSIGWDGNTVTSEQLESVLHAFGIVAQIVGLLTAYVNRVLKGDISWTGKRKLADTTIDSLPQ